VDKHSHMHGRACGRTQGSPLHLPKHVAQVFRSAQATIGYELCVVPKGGGQRHPQDAASDIHAFLSSLERLSHPDISGWETPSGVEFGDEPGLGLAPLTLANNHHALNKNRSHLGLAEPIMNLA
jgi:hypothetical protein